VKHIDTLVYLHPTQQSSNKYRNQRMYSPLITYIKKFPMTEKVSVKVGDYTEHAKVKAHLLKKLNFDELRAIANSMLFDPPRKTTKEEFVDWILHFPSFEGLNSSTNGARSVVKTHLSCPICYDWLEDPRVLSCGHVFCRSCIDKWRLRIPQAFVCPVCKRHETGPPVHCLVIKNLIEAVASSSSS
jgi:hypothetical protein